jgi:hypothetical protein
MAEEGGGEDLVFRQGRDLNSSASMKKMVKMHRQPSYYNSDTSLRKIEEYLQYRGKEEDYPADSPMRPYIRAGDYLFYLIAVKKRFTFFTIANTVLGCLLCLLETIIVRTNAALNIFKWINFCLFVFEFAIRVMSVLVSISS